MKFLKGLAILSFFTIVLGSCFDPPEFPVVPEIVFDDIRFIDAPSASDADTLLLKLRFKDGDGDLGLDPQDPQYSMDPFQYANYFQTTGNGQVNKITTYPATVRGQNNTTSIIDILEIADPNLGQLAFPRTRNNPAYSSLPEFSCLDYEYKEFIIAASDVAVLDDVSSIRDTLSGETEMFYLVRDTLLIEINPDHYNIEVDFLVKEGSTFTEFDWRKEFCTTFDGRFDLMLEDPRAIDGTLSYNMTSTGFKILFGGKTIKLSVKIRDRARNESNVIETREFII